MLSEYDSALWCVRQSWVWLALLRASAVNAMKTIIGPKTSPRPSGVALEASIAQHRRSITINTIMAVIVYMVLSTASHGGCLGGMNADGSSVDANSNPASMAPMCVQATLHPSVWIVALLVIVGAIGRLLVRQRGTTVERVTRITNNTTVITIGAMLVALTLSLVVFFSFDLSAWHPGQIPWFTFPLNVEVLNTP